MRTNLCLKARERPLIYTMKEGLKNESTLPPTVKYEIKQGKAYLVCSKEQEDKFTYYGFQEYCSILEQRSKL